MNPGFVLMVVPIRKGNSLDGCRGQDRLGLHPYLFLLVVNTAGLRLLSLERLSCERKTHGCHLETCLYGDTQVNSAVHLYGCGLC